MLKIKDISKMSSFSMVGLNEYLAKVKALKGKKVKMASPIHRVVYEEKSVNAGHWLTLSEYIDSLDTS